MYVHESQVRSVKTKPFYYGGQAVMEGVMMRGRSSMAVAVRAPDGRIVMYEEALQPGRVLLAVRNIPFLRGAIVLWDTLLLGMRALIFSANVGLQEEQAADGETTEQQEPEMLTGPLLWLTVALSLAFSIGLFFVLPLVAVKLLERFVDSHFVANLIEGLVRLAILIGYMLAISTMRDIRRVFAYHGAEHMTINAYEAGVPVDVANVRAQSLAHLRCGTGFLLIVMLLAVLFFATLGLFGEMSFPVMILSRIVFVPVIAALAYEIIRFGAAHAEQVVVRLILTPGLWLQRITTRQPEDDMLEVAIAAFKRVLATDAVITIAELDPTVVMVDTLGRPLVLVQEPVLT